MAHADKKQISLYLTEEEIEKLNRYAEKIGISRQQLLSNIIKEGLNDLAMMEKMKILGIGMGIRDLLYKVKTKQIDPDLFPDQDEKKQS